VCCDLIKHPRSAALLIASAVFCEIVDTVVSSLTPSVKKPVRRLKELLIVRPDAIGDFVLFLDTFKEYRKLYPADEWHITLLGNQAWADLARNLPYADQFWFIDCRRFCQDPFYRYRFLRAVRQIRFDVVIQPVFSREYSIGDAVIRATAAVERIGNVGDSSNISTWQKRRSDRWYSRLIPSSHQAITELERNAEFIRKLGLHTFQASAPVLPINKLPEFSQRSAILIETPYFVVVPGAGSTDRQWAEENFAEVAKCLFMRTGWTPVLCGDVDESLLAKKITTSITKVPWMDFVGKTTLSEMISILNSARMLIGNESATIHLAAAVGCPTVCIMGGGHFGRFFPYGNFAKNRIVYKKMDCFGCNWICRYSKPRCLEEISVKQVLGVVYKMLRRHSSWLCLERIPSK
jgi:ADP-heptose:LPS heptosyltransferase